MAREFRGKIPRVPVDADTSRADQKIDRLFQKIKKLENVEIDANVSQAQRRLETLVKRTNSQLSSGLIDTMLKDFKTVLGAMKSEFENVGITSDIYKKLEKTCDMVEDRFSNLTISVDKKKISGLTEILNTVTEIQSISDFSFGDIISKQTVKNAESVLSNIKETKKEINSIVGKIDYIQKTLSKNTDKSFSTEKLNQYKDKLHELRGMLKGFYSIDDEIIQNSLLNAAAKINEALGQIDIKLPKSKSAADILSVGETVKGLDNVKKKVKETSDEYESLEKIITKSRNSILGKEFNNLFGDAGRSVEGHAKALAKVRDKMSEIKDEAYEAKVAYESTMTAIDAYTGRNLGNKTAFQNAIKDSWKSGEYQAAAKLFEQYQTRFSDGKFNPAKQFGSNWSDNFVKNLEEANRSLSIWRAQLKNAAAEYGKWSAFVKLQENERLLQSGYEEALRDRAAAEQEAAKAAQTLEQAQKDFATDDLTTAQKNLNTAIDEYNSRLEKSNKLLAEKRRLEDLESYENEPWYKEGELPVNHIIENAKQLAEAEDAVNLYTIALKEAVRVYRELGGDMKLPFSDEALLKEIDIPVKVVATVEKSKYYEIDEGAAKRAKEANSFSDYTPGSATRAYRQAIDELSAIVESKKKQFPDRAEELDRMLDTYAKRYAEYINKQNAIDASVPSVLVAGPAGIKQSQKDRQNQRREANYKFFQEKIAVLEDKIKDIGTGPQVIRSDDANALEDLEKKVEDLKKAHQIMVEANKYFRKNKNLDGFDKLPDEMKKDIEETRAAWGQPDMQPFPQYKLQNSNQEIKRLEGRIKELKGLQDSEGLKEINEVYSLITDKNDMRIRISFEMGKPDQEVIDMLKGKAFKWSSKNSAWQRQLTANALRDTKILQKSLQDYFKIDTSSEEYINTTQEIDKLSAAYDEMSQRAGRSFKFSEEYARIFDEVKKGALSAADAIKQLNEFIGTNNLDTQIKVKETAELIGRLHTDYADRFDSIFGETMNSFGALDTSNAVAMYDALIAKEKEYIDIARQRTNAVGEFVKSNNDLLGQFANTDNYNAVEVKFGELSTGILEGSVGLEEANKQLEEFTSTLLKAVDSVKEENKLLEEQSQLLHNLQKKSSSDFTPYRISHNEALDVVRSRLDEDELKAWYYGSGDGAVRDKLGKMAISDDELRNAGLNLLFDQWQLYGDKIFQSFEEFVNSEIELYRGTSKQKEQRDSKGEFTSFSFNETTAKKFMPFLEDENNTPWLISHTTKVKDTLGYYGTTPSKELEVIVPKNQVKDLEAVIEANDNLISSNKEVVESFKETTDVIKTQDEALNDYYKSSLPDKTFKQLTQGTDINDLLKMFSVPTKDRPAIQAEFDQLVDILYDILVNGNYSEDAYNLHKDKQAAIEKMIADVGYSANDKNPIYEEFYNYMKGIQIAYTDSDKAEFGDDWSNIIKKFGSGKYKVLTKDSRAISADQLYGELLEIFPALFDSDIWNEHDQLKKILSVLQQARYEHNDKAKKSIGLGPEEINYIHGVLENSVGTISSNAMLVHDEIQKAAEQEAKLAEQAQVASKAIEGENNAAKKFANNLSNLINGEGDSDTVENIIEMADQTKSMIELISSAAGKSAATKFLEGITSETDLKSRITGYFNEVFNSDDWKFKEGKGALSMKGDTLVANLVNSSQDAIHAVLKLDEGVLRLQDDLLKFDKANIVDNFNLEGAISQANAAVRDLKAQLGGRAYDGLSGLETLSEQIVDEASFKNFTQQLKIAKQEVAALKKEYSSGSGTLNDFSRATEVMRNAETSIETMRLKLEGLGNVNGVDKATEALKKMADASKEFKIANDETGQKNAYTKYNQAKADYEVNLEYAKESKKAADAEAKQINPIREQYQSILNLINQINSKSSEITKYQAKDGGSGIFASYIEQLQSEKSRLVSELKGITDEINSTLGSGFIQGKEFSVPFASFLDGSGAISSFLNDTRTQASLTTEEIEKLVATLQKSQNIDAEAASKVAEQFKSVQETYKRLSDLTGLDQNNESYQALAGVFGQIMQYKKTLSSDPTSWTPEESSHLQTLIDQFTKYGNALAAAGEKEAKYFAGKKRYSKDKTSSEAQEAVKDTEKVLEVRKKLEEAARGITEREGIGEPIFTKFTQGADGIAKLDFSAIEQGTGILKTFRVEMGSVTQGIYETETTITKSMANIKAAENQINSMNDLMGRLNLLGVGTDGNSGVAQVDGLVKKFQALSAELSKGENADQTVISRLITESKMASGEVEKLYKQMIQMENDIASGKAQSLGVGDTKGDVYGQLVEATKKVIGANQNATIEFGRFDAATNTLNGSLVHANGTVENFQVRMDHLSGQMAAQQTGVSKLTTSWDRFKTSIGHAGKQLMTALVGYNVFFKAISEVRKGIGYVKEIDLALTELKKVTDETEASYKKFLNTAAGTAGEIGSTLSDFTEATANFARLGYTMDESADMAKTAIVYKNVADGLDTVEESTDSIISTMKAFGIESDDTMGIIDRFNEVKITCLPMW